MKGILPLAGGEEEGIVKDRSVKDPITITLNWYSISKMKFN